MPATYKDNGGSVNGSNKVFTYDFPVLQTEDVKVSLDGVTQATTKYTVSLSPANITFNNTSVDTSVQATDGAPKTGVTVRVFRHTTVGKTDGNEDPKAVFASGNAIRAGNLNANFEQTLFGIHELQEQPFISDDLEKPIVFNDDEKAIFGTGRDAEIYHGGTNTRFKNDTGDLVISCGSDDIRLAAKDDIYLEVNATDSGATSTENGIIVHGNGAVKLYFDNSEKVRTRAEGAIIFGVLQADGIEVHDNEEIKVGLGGDLKFKHNGTNSSIENITGDLNITCSGDDIDITAADDIHIRPQGGEEGIIVTGNGSVDLYHNNVFKAGTTAGGFDVTGDLNITGHFTIPDNSKLLIGTGSDDLEIYHNTNSYVNNNTGHLYIQNVGSNDDSNIYIRARNEEHSIVCHDDGAVELYYNGNEKLSTSANGISVTGTVFADGVDLGDNEKILLGEGDDLEISHDGSHSYLLNSTGHLYIQNYGSNDDSNIYISARDDESSIICKDDGAVELFHDGTKKFETRSGGVWVQGVVDAHDGYQVASEALNLGHLANVHNATPSDGQVLKWINANSRWEPAQDSGAGGASLSDGDYGDITVASSGSTFTIDDDVITGAKLANNLDIPDNNKIRFGTGNDLEIYHTGSGSIINDAGQGHLHLRVGGSNRVNLAGSAVELCYDGSKKFDTTSEGSKAYGIFRVEGTEGADGKLVIQADEGDDTDDFTRLRHGADGYFYIENYASGSYETAIRLNGDGAVDLFYDNSKKFETTTHGIRVLGSEGGDGIIQLYADEGDDNADLWRMVASASSSAFRLYNYADGAWEDSLKANGAGSVELFYDGAKKLETTTDGATVSGSLKVGDSNKIKIGDGADLQLYHNGTDSYILNYTGATKVQAADFRVLNQAGDETQIRAIEAGAVELYYNDTKVLQTASTGVDIDDALHIYNNGSHNEGHIIIRPRSASASNNHIWIGTRDSSTQKYRFCIDGDGELRTNSAHFAGVQRDDNSSPTNHFNSTDRIRFSAFRGTSDNSEYRSRAIFGCASSDWDDYRVLYYVDAQDDAAVDYDQDQTLSMSGSGRINCMRSIWAGRVESDEATPNSVYAGAETGVYAYANDNTDYTFIFGRNVADQSMVFHSQVNGEVNVEIEADGSARTDGTWSDSNADYAECFEWADGNGSAEERRGMTVVLDGEKVKLATDSDNKDNIIGVVSPEPVVLGDAAPLGWHGRYKKDAYGSPIRKEQEWLIWKKEYHYEDGVKVLSAQPDPNKPQTLNGDVERIRIEDINKPRIKNLIPAFALTNNIRYKTYGKDIDTTDYDPTKAYIPRKDRKEWDAIGMVGKLVVRRGQPVGTRWLLMKENIGTDTDGTVLDRYLVR